MTTLREIYTAAEESNLGGDDQVELVRDETGKLYVQGVGAGQEEPAVMGAGTIDPDAPQIPSTDD